MSLFLLACASHLGDVGSGEKSGAQSCDTCIYAGDQVCDDGSQGGDVYCDPGTDCSDCGNAPSGTQSEAMSTAPDYWSQSGLTWEEEAVQIAQSTPFMRLASSNAQCVATYAAAGGALTAGACVVAGVATSGGGVGVALLTVCATNSAAVTGLGALIAGAIGMLVCSPDTSVTFDAIGSAPVIVLESRTSNVRYACQKLNLDRHQCNRAIHGVKEDGGLGPADNVEIDTETGEVYDKGTGGYVGNLNDYN